MSLHRLPKDEEMLLAGANQRHLNDHELCERLNISVLGLLHLKDRLLKKGLIQEERSGNMVFLRPTREGANYLSRMRGYASFPSNSSRT